MRLTPSRRSSRLSRAAEDEAGNGNGAEASGDYSEGTIIKRRKTRKIEKPVTRQVKVKTTREVVVPFKTTAEVKTTNYKMVPGFDILEEQYVDMIPQKKKRKKMIWVEKEVEEEYTKMVPVTKTRRVKRKTQKFRQERKEITVEVPGTKVIEVDGWRIDEIECQKWVEVEEEEEFELQPHATGRIVKKGERDLGIQKTEVCRREGHEVFDLDDESILELPEDIKYKSKRGSYENTSSQDTRMSSSNETVSSSRPLEETNYGGPLEETNYGGRLEETNYGGRLEETNYGGPSEETGIGGLSEETGSNGLSLSFFDHLSRDADRDYVIVVDKSGSMAGANWSQVQQALNSVVQMTGGKGTAFALYFFSSGRPTRYKNVKDEQTLKVAFSQQTPSGSTNLTYILKAVFQEHFKQRGKKTSILCITDGAPNNPNTVVQNITSCSNKLRSSDEISLSFVQVGDEGGATEFLKFLDDDLQCKYDMVDTLGFQGLSDAGSSFLDFMQQY